jgi:hypothetical protein
MCHENALIDSKCMYVHSPLENVFRELKWIKVASQNLCKCTTSNFIQVTSVLSALLRRLSFSRLCSCRKWRGIVSQKNGNFQHCCWRKDRRYEKLILIFELMFETRQKLVIKEGRVHFSAPNNSSLCFFTYTQYFFQKRGGWIWNLILSWAWKWRRWQ